MRLLLDTNVAIDILTNRQPFCDDSISCYKKAVLRGDKVFISTVSVADIMYITKNNFSDRANQLETVSNFINTLKIAKITSKDLRLKYIITRNAKDFGLSPVKAIEPCDF